MLGKNVTKKGQGVKHLQVRGVRKELAMQTLDKHLREVSVPLDAAVREDCSEQCGQQVQRP